MQKTIAPPAPALDTNDELMPRERWRAPPRRPGLDPGPASFARPALIPLALSLSKRRPFLFPHTPPHFGERGKPAMTLITDLQRAISEEDVKAAYIKALDLKDYTQGLVDIRTDKVWFEAKGVPTAPLLMFAQLLVYVRGARARGEPIPPFLAVIDREKGAILDTRDALLALEDDTIAWPASGSAADRTLATALAPHIDGRFTTYPILTMADEFRGAIAAAIRDGEIIRTPITPDNLRQVFDKWVAMIGGELDVANPADLATLFFADIMHDGDQAAYASVGASLVTQDGRPAFFLRGSSTLLPVTNLRAYRDFWSIYLRPPEERHRRWLIERRDSLLPFDEQRFKGAFYTPLHIVDKAYEQLHATLGDGWQDRYIVWDMCAGVGNLEAKHSNLRNVFMSTLDQADVDFMRTVEAFAGAEIFQYDYLNDDVTDFGEIDYTLTGKVPVALQQAIVDAKARKEGAKPILVLINPPYAEATGGGLAVPMARSTNKLGVANTQFARASMAQYGKATNELSMQFMARIYKEMPNSVLALMSKIKYVSTPTLQKFREVWKATYCGGFAVHSRSFEGLKGDFPIGFLIWDTATDEPIGHVTALALNRAGDLIGEKTFLNYDGLTLLTDWVQRPVASNEEAVPLKGAITPATATKDLRGERWSEGAIGWLNCAGNDLQNAAEKTMLLSSGYGSARGFFVTTENLWQAAIVFSVRRLVRQTWVNDRDQFLQPSELLTDEFKCDCLVWMLFNGSNLTAGADGLRWDDRDWSLINHFIPFTEQEVGARGRFESDFMVRYMQGMAFSAEARAVLEAGRALWARFHSTSFPKSVREEFRLNRPDAGWYQIRRALKAYGDTELTDFDPFDAAYSALGTKLRPMVFKLGFLPR